MRVFNYLKTIPSFYVSSAKQTLATLQPRIPFEPAPPRPTVLVPGAFCTGSVMNRLGRELEGRGLSVCVPPSFPYYLSALANTCRLQRSAEAFSGWLDDLAARHRVSKVDVVGHSNGALIALLGVSMLRRVRVRRVVTMAAPFGGFPAARPLGLVIPCCRDIFAGSAVLEKVLSAKESVALCLVADRDSLLPPVVQFLSGSRKVVMEGFQHMDFIVGKPEQIGKTADEIVRCLNNGA
jgi:pimeloyl-ACP methyl ester carboxylesterase